MWTTHWEKKYRRRKTCGHVGDGSGCGLGIRRPRGVQVPQHVDVRGKVDHVLLPAAVRHSDQTLQAVDGWTENVAFGTNQTTIYLIYHVQILILTIQLEGGRGQSTTPSVLLRVHLQ